MDARRIRALLKHRKDEVYREDDVRRSQQEASAAAEPPGPLFGGIGIGGILWLVPWRRR